MKRTSDARKDSRKGAVPGAARAAGEEGGQEDTQDPRPPKRHARELQRELQRDSTSNATGKAANEPAGKVEGKTAGKTVGKMAAKMAAKEEADVRCQVRVALWRILQYAKPRECIRAILSKRLDAKDIPALVGRVGAWCDAPRGAPNDAPRDAPRGAPAEACGLVLQERRAYSYAQAVNGILHHLEQQKHGGLFQQLLHDIRDFEVASHVTCRMDVGARFNVRAHCAMQELARLRFGNFRAGDLVTFRDTFAIDSPTATLGGQPSYPNRLVIDVPCVLRASPRAPHDAPPDAPPGAPHDAPGDSRTRPGGGERKTELKTELGAEGPFDPVACGPVLDLSDVSRDSSRVAPELGDSHELWACPQKLSVQSVDGLAELIRSLANIHASLGWSVRPPTSRQRTASELPHCDQGLLTLLGLADHVKDAGGLVAKLEAGRPGTRAGAGAFPDDIGAALLGLLSVPRRLVFACAMRTGTAQLATTTQPGNQVVFEEREEPRDFEAALRDLNRNAHVRARYGEWRVCPAPDSKGGKGGAVRVDRQLIGHSIAPPAAGAFAPGQSLHWLRHAPPRLQVVAHSLMHRLPPSLRLSKDCVRTVLRFVGGASLVDAPFTMEMPRMGRLDGHGSDPRIVLQAMAAF